MPRYTHKLDFLQKGLGIDSLFYGFSRKMFHVLYSINSPNLLSGHLNFWKYWAICVLESFANQFVTS